VRWAGSKRCNSWNVWPIIELAVTVDAVMNLNQQEPVKTRNGRFFGGHWTGFIFMLPFVVLFLLHEPLGMTDALLMGDRVSANYNLWTFAALILGSFAFIVHALSLPSGKGPGGSYVMPKLIFLLLLWGAALLVTSCTRITRT
jgi:hypothetical protein